MKGLSCKRGEITGGSDFGFWIILYDKLASVATDFIIMNWTKSDIKRDLLRRLSAVLSLSLYSPLQYFNKMEDVIKINNELNDLLCYRYYPRKWIKLIFSNFIMKNFKMFEIRWFETKSSNILILQA